MTPDVTLTTACLDLTQYFETSRDLNTAIESMRTLLEIPVYLVIFCDTKTYPAIQAIREPHADKTYYIVLNLSMLWSYQYIDKVKENRAKYHPTKDARTCAESHILCCNKFDFVLQTIHLNPFKTSKFGWIDANLGPNASKVCTDYKPDMLPYILNNVCDKFRIQLINVTNKKYKKPENLKEAYEQYRWVVAGCLFTTSKYIGIRILNRLKELFVETTNFGFGHAEEALFLPVLDEYYDDIYRTYGDYQHTFNNFIKPTVGFSYIRSYLLNNYTNFEYWKEGYDCSKIISAEYNGQSGDEWFEILYHTYLHKLYYKKEEAEPYLKIFKQYIIENPVLYEEFNRRKDFYRQQFAYNSTLMNDL